MRVLGLVVLVGCANAAPGTPCTRTGDGFTSRDPCSTRCIFYEVACVGGSRATPNVCEGAPCTTDAECGAGNGCAQTAADAYACLPASVCPSGFHREPLVVFQ